MAHSQDIALPALPASCACTLAAAMSPALCPCCLPGRPRLIQTELQVVQSWLWQTFEK